MSLASISSRGIPTQPRYRYLYLLLAVVLATLAYPPLDAGFLAWIALAPLFYVVPQATRIRHAFGYGYLFGYLHWGLTITWIGTTVTTWSHTPFGWIAWILLTAVKSGWFGLFGALCWWIDRRVEGTRRILCMACAWTLIEWFRGQGSLAMPWSLIGYTQYRYLPLIQIADLTGIHAITFSIALMNAAIAEMFRRSGVPAFRHWVDRQATEEGTERSGGARVVSGWRTMVLPFAAVSMLLIYGAFALTHRYEGKTVRLALMQPNLRQERNSWEAVERELQMCRRLTTQVTPQNPDIVIWPETAAPEDAVEKTATHEAFSEMALISHAHHIVGTNHAGSRNEEYNSAVLFTPDGRLATRYDKRWPVPFGEWIPMRQWMPFSNVFRFREEDVIPGHTDDPFVIGDVRAGILICYESIFPVVVRASVRHGANLLVSITNDSWAGVSAEPAQHSAMTILRAVETRRYVASAATTGITGLINPFGSIQPIAPYREGTFVCEARLLDGQTIFVRWGDWFVALCAFGMVVGLWRRKQVS